MRAAPQTAKHTSSFVRQVSTPDSCTDVHIVNGHKCDVNWGLWGVFPIRCVCVCVCALCWAPERHVVAVHGAVRRAEWMPLWYVEINLEVVNYFKHKP